MAVRRSPAGAPPLGGGAAVVRTNMAEVEQAQQGVGAELQTVRTAVEAERQAAMADFRRFQTEATRRVEAEQGRFEELGKERLAEIEARATAELAARLVDLQVALQDTKLAELVTDLKRDLWGPAQSKIAKLLGEFATLAGNIALSLDFARVVGSVVVGLANAIIDVRNATYHDWTDQLWAWRALHSAAEDGSRLPLYDRMFRFRGGGGIGHEMKNVRKLFLNPAVVPALQATADQMGWDFDYEPDGDLFNSYFWIWLRAEDEGVTWPSPIIAPGAWPMSRDIPWDLQMQAEVYNRPYIVSWPIDLSPHFPGRTSLEPRPPYNHVRFSFPDIPVDLWTNVPGEYILFWTAPVNLYCDVDEDDNPLRVNPEKARRLLRTFEEARFRYLTGGAAAGDPVGTAVGGYTTHVSGTSIYTAVRPSFEVGTGMLPIDWGPARDIHFNRLVMDPDFIAGDWMFVDVQSGLLEKMKGIGEFLLGSDTWAMISKLPPLVTPDAYNQMLDDMDRFAGPVWRAHQEADSLRNDPVVMWAVALARDARKWKAGDMSGRDPTPELAGVLTHAKTKDPDALRALFYYEVALNGFPGEGYEGSR